MKATHAIVVLGAAVDGDRPRPTLEARLLAAHRAFAAGRAERLIVTGRGEADPMRRRLVELGVPEGAITLESRARNTRENAMFVAALVPSGAHVLLVTQPSHQQRAQALFRRCGLSVEAILADERFSLYTEVRERVAYRLHALLGLV